MEAEGTEQGAGIAIVGMAGRFPGADDLAGFWANLCAGRESIAGFTLEDLVAAGLPRAEVESAHYVRAKGLLADADCFDAAFFGIAPRTAQLMDPQQRLFLECAWQALEDAGYTREPPGRRIGVFAGGAAMSSYYHENLLADPATRTSSDPFQLFLLNQPAGLPTQVAWHLHLTGPALAVQSACSTGLAAVAVACQNLLDMQCDLALAGAAALSLPLVHGYRHQAGGILSPDGHCRPFDAAAGGTVPGNGVGAVVLKRLDDALADGDRIDAVIRGFAMNNDGHAKAGFTAPGVEGQAQVIADALAMAGLEPAAVGYLEAHGTATALGDAIELEALRRVFAGVAPGRCGLGSVKGNIGHLDAAAGIAGLIKAVLALRHGFLPPSLHYRRPNPELRLENSPFAVVAAGRPWPAGAAPRIAGVSSFGIGGTNVHCLLAEAPPAPGDPAGLAVQLLPLSAASPGSLARAAASLAARLAGEEPPSLAAVARTLQGRLPLRHRLAVAAGGAAEAADALRRAVALVAEDMPRGPVFLFPGQGAQHAGMAAELVAAVPDVGAELEEGCRRLAALGLELRPWFFAPRQDAEANRRLAETALAQPALFLVGHALAGLLRRFGVQPAACLGHSVGEFAAATVAGVLDYDDALRLVAERGRVLQAQPRGAMLSVRLSPAALAPFLPDGVEIAAINAADLCVAAGPEAAIAAAAAALAEAGVPCRRLVTSHAFHSAMMASAREPFLAALAGVALRAPALPLASSATGTWLRPEEARDPVYWADQLRRPVRFAAGLDCLLAADHRHFLELGPGGALAALALRQGSGEQRPQAWPLLAPATAAAGDLTALLQALGGVWSSGQELDWEPLWPTGRPRPVSLPPYPFERRRHWVGAAPAATPDQPAPAPQPLEPLPDSAEEAIAALWRRHLGHAEIGLDEEFHRLGGDSLLAVRIAAELREQFGGALEPHELLAYATPRRLAERLRRGAGGAGPFCRVQLRAGDSTVPPLVLFHAVGGTVNLYGDLVAALDSSLPVIAYQSASLDGETPPDPSVEAMAARYLADLRSLQTAGPYRLAGSSFGGMIAFEVARQLAAAGEAVSLLALLDSPGPGDLPRALADDAAVLSYIAELLGHPLEEAALRDLPLEAQLQRFLAAAAPSLPPGITAGEFARYLAAFKSNTLAMRAYDPPAATALPPLLFFKAATRDSHTPAAPERAWQRLLPHAALEVITVPGTHLSMLAAENLDALLRRLAPALRAAG